MAHPPSAMRKKNSYQEKHLVPQQGKVNYKGAKIRKNGLDRTFEVGLVNSNDSGRDYVNFLLEIALMSIMLPVWKIIIISITFKLIL